MLCMILHVVLSALHSDRHQYTHTNGESNISLNGPVFHDIRFDIDIGYGMY
jgi:hypothetical protein